MNIDINTVLDEIKALLQSKLSSGSAALVGLTEYVSDAKSRLLTLAAGAASGELSYQFVVKRLAEEKTNLKDLVLTTTQLIESEAEDLVNESINALRDFIEKAATV